MAAYRVSLSFPYDSALPRDRITINPHFNGDNPGALADALKTNLTGWPATSLLPCTIKVYDAAAPPPSYPLAVSEKAGTTPNSPHPRELALCLSYYTTYNRPRYRGRLYLPSAWVGGTPGLRPTQAMRDEVLAFGQQVLMSGMPSAHNWIVWSTVERKAMGGVSDIWCDDEWDIVRSRGLKPTARSEARLARTDAE